MRNKDTEIWKAVPDSDGLLASSWGRVVKQPSCCPMPNGALRWYKPKPTYGYETRAKRGAAHSYRGIYLRGLGNIKIHQAVCAAFHGSKPFDGAVVIHLDEDAHNNRPENLKWGTQKENLNMPNFIEYCKGRTGENNPYIKGLATQEEDAA